MTDVFTLNTASGVTGFVHEDMLDHPVFGKYLVPVDEGTPSYEPTKFKAQTADEYLADKDARKAEKEKAKAEAEAAAQAEKDAAEAAAKANADADKKAETE